jgi:hypothetical protein
MLPNSTANHTIGGVALLSAILMCYVIGCATNTQQQEATKAYYYTLSAWSAGSQVKTDALLDRDVKRFPSDQRLAFFHAASVRSRFAPSFANPLFGHVIAMNSTSPLGKCAHDIIELDNGHGEAYNFSDLLNISRNHPKDPIILWMVAIQCRSHNQPDLGIICYKTLLGLIHGPGPSQIHQDYAYLLDQAGNHETALSQRDLAFKLDPNPSNCKSLARSLDKLGRHGKADQLRKAMASKFNEANQ